MTLYKLLVVLLLCIISFAAGLWAAWATTRKSAESHSLHAGLTIDRFTDLSELFVVRLEVSDVVLSSINGRTGGIQILLLVRGDVSLGVDLSAARFDAIDRTNQVAVLVLPVPSPSKPRVDHDRTRTVLIQKQGLWVLSPAARSYAAVVDQAMAQAESAVNAAGTTLEADRRARAHAELVLQTFFRSLDWKVQIRWADRS